MENESSPVLQTVGTFTPHEKSVHDTNKFIGWCVAFAIAAFLVLYIIPGPEFAMLKTTLYILLMNYLLWLIAANGCDVWASALLWNTRVRMLYIVQLPLPIITSLFSTFAIHTRHIYLWGATLFTLLFHVLICVYVYETFVRTPELLERISAREIKGNSSERVTLDRKEYSGGCIHFC